VLKTKWLNNELLAVKNDGLALQRAEAEVVHIPASSKKYAHAATLDGKEDNSVTGMGTQKICPRRAQF
jgi:hypothetical protein